MLDVMEKLCFVFIKDGSVMVGNVLGLNDGVVVLLIMIEDEVVCCGLMFLVCIVFYVIVGVDLVIMGSGLILVSCKVLEKVGWLVGDLDLVEVNEVFVVQVCVVNKDMGWNFDIVNVNGGVIVIGYLIGVLGVWILNMLLFEMKWCDVQKGFVILCIGGGMGVVMCLEC